MPTYDKCPASVHQMMVDIMSTYDCYQVVIDANVKVDLLFAFSDKDPTTGESLNDAIRHQGRKALGVCRKISLKDRVKGMGDVEITLDGDWWNEATEEQQKALLDHELYHIVTTEDKDDAGRPIVKMRKHDVDVGWFAVVSIRHGKHSMEQSQASTIFDIYEQAFFPFVKSSKNKALDVEEKSKIIAEIQS